MGKEEQILALSKLLIKLIEEEAEDKKPSQEKSLEQVNDPRQLLTNDTKNDANQYRLKTIQETLEDFKTLGIEVDVVRRIMQRVNEVYGDRTTGNYDHLYGNLNTIRGIDLDNVDF